MSLELITLPIGQLQAAVVSAVEAGVRLVILGPPGVGKTQILQQAAAAMGRRYTEMLIAGRDTGDVYMPYVDPKSGTLVQKLNPKIPFVGNPEFSETTPILLNIDEFTGGTRLMQNIMLKVLDEGLVGDTPLRDDVGIVATGNRSWDLAHVEQLSAALANRATFVTVDPDLDAFLSYGIANDFHPIVLAWVKMDPSYLLQFSPEQFLAGDPAFCSPRSNERLSNILHQRDKGSMPDTVFRSLVCGTIGNAVGIKFTGFCKIKDELPDLDAVMAGQSARTPKEAAVIYATLVALVQRMVVMQREKKAKPVLKPVLDYISKFPTEFHQLFISTFSKAVPELVPTSEWGSFMAKNAGNIVA